MFSALVVSTAVLAVALLVRYLEDVTIAASVALVVLVPTAIWVSRRFARRARRTVLAISDGIASLKDSDFSVSIAQSHDDELGELIKVYNALGGTLRDERQDLLQRELLLDTVIQSTPLALLLTDEAGHIMYSNFAARELFSGGKKPEGLALESLLGAVLHR